MRKNDPNEPAESAVQRPTVRPDRRWHTAAMPELPDIAVYIDRLGARIIGHRLEGVRVLSPFPLRTAVPPIAPSTVARCKASNGSASAS